MTGAHALCGGIAGANLNILHALMELAHEREARLTVFSLLEQDCDRSDFLPESVGFRAFRGNKQRFLLNILRAARRRPVFCFDHVRLALPVLPLAAAGAVKTIIFAHGSESWKRLRRTSRWSFQSATLCLTNSEFTLCKMREQILEFNGAACPLGLSPDFILNSEVPNGPDGSTEFEAADGITRPLGKRFLLLVGRMLAPGPSSEEGRKGHRHLIDILPGLLKQFPDVRLVFPGPGDDRQNLIELARSRSVASLVFFPGLVSIEVLKSLYRNCYAFVMPSRQEGFGLVYLEAMNYAKPCVGCFDQGAGDIIVHGETGFLVRDPDHSQELLGILCRLLRDPELARSLGKSGFERLHRYFTACHYQRRIKETMSRVL